MSLGTVVVEYGLGLKNVWEIVGEYGLGLKWDPYFVFDGLYTWALRSSPPGCRYTQPEF